MGTGIYPTMSVAEVMTSLQEWGLNVSPEQLHRPSQDFVEGIYCFFLQKVTELDKETLSHAVQDVLDASQSDETDYYAAALTSNVLMYHLFRFAKAARIEDFCAKDVFNPHRERTLKILSGFINFVKFVEQFCSPFTQELKDSSSALLVEKTHISERLSEIQQKLDVLKAKIAEEEPICERLRTENFALRAKMITTKEFQTAAVQEVEKLKAEKNGFIKRRTVLHAEIDSVSDAIGHTRSRVVQSPERIKRTILTMSATALEEKRTVALHESKARDLQAKLNGLSNNEKDVRSCVEQFQVIEKEISVLDVSRKELAELRDQIDNKTIERNEFKLKLERVGRQLANAHEKIERAQKHAQDKKLFNQNKIEKLQDEYEKMIVERRENDKHLEELRKEADGIEAKRVEHLRNTERELTELLTEYWRLRHEAEVYMETLANKLNMNVVTD